MSIPAQIVVLGLVTGCVYALIGVGITVTYKVLRVLNLAHGQVAALASLIVPVFAIKAGLPYGVAVLIALAVAAACSALTEIAVIRRLARSSRLVVLVATIGLAQLFGAIGGFIPKSGLATHLYPLPFHVSLDVGSVHLATQYLLMLVVAPIAVGALALFLRRTTIGLAARAAADNSDAARLTGIPVRRISLTMWTVAGLLAGIAGVLIGPTQQVGTTTTLLGPDLLLRALAAAMIGGLTSLPTVAAAGVGLGVLEAVLGYNSTAPGIFDIALFAIVLASLFIRRDLRAAVRSVGDSEGAWSLAGAMKPLPDWIRRAANVRRFRAGVMAAVLAAATLIPLGMTNSGRVLAATVVVLAIAGVSLVVLTGYAGQVSLGQFAFVELGALVAGRMYQLGYPLWMCLLYAVAAGGVAALVVGIPALRVRGLYLAVTTLAFAVAANSWLTQQHWLVNDTSEQLPRPHWFGVNWSSELRYYWLCLAVLVVVGAAVARLRRTGLGRALVGVRDNEIGAASLGVPPRRAKLTAFVLAGVIASGAGMLYGALLGGYADPNIFLPQQSLALVAFVVLGGVTTVTGAVMGALFVYGLGYLLEPYFAGSGVDPAFLLSSVGLLVAILAFPGGLAEPLMRLRDAIATRLAGDEPAHDTTARPQLDPMLGPTNAPTGTPAIECHDVVVRYGGHTVLDRVSMRADHGEIVGLVGPNGAGKTTLFDVLSGHQHPDAGRVLLSGSGVTLLRPEQRAQLKVARTFQQARLYPALTVREAVQLALECTERSEAVPSLLALPPSMAAERAKGRRADELIGLMGLGRYADTLVAELSTGTRRLVEIATAVALQPTVLLLDEPTAGVAQREVEAFAAVLVDVRAHLDATVVLIEHDLPLVTSVADRMYVLAAGVVLAEGTPKKVTADPAVIAAYLGTDERVVARSDVRRARTHTARSRPRKRTAAKTSQRKTRETSEARR
jgi:ABC-type branched-subunit amino acid transport system ATPase component/ABC-type branched-subunit amino acid transport system permease subunit